MTTDASATTPAILPEYGSAMMTLDAVKTRMTELDRLSRDLVTTMSFIEELHALGGNLVAIKEGFDPRDPLGQLQTAIIGTFAQ